ncbi:hypothetical protein MHLP_00435 [Candidatus Mycoplasma haematolamae str. Purdue]|uniref:Uncharacterized protein n=1 Tax=Mycoplasma haematolamae (strain Purdue) TaxID=1212765 RepID=I7C583_MYCHA|nr:hypothetical protein MHLP_00435 [Candidatus Mycoplasma haematolamae str. Purdue]
MESGHSNTHLLRSEEWLDPQNQDLKSSMERVYKYHPGLKEWLKGWIKKHDKCNYTPAQHNEYKMDCSTVRN